MRGHKDSNSIHQPGFSFHSVPSPFSSSQTAERIFDALLKDTPSFHPPLNESGDPNKSNKKDNGHIRPSSIGALPALLQIFRTVLSPSCKTLFLIHRGTKPSADSTVWETISARLASESNMPISGPDAKELVTIMGQGRKDWHSSQNAKRFPDFGPPTELAALADEYLALMSEIFLLGPSMSYMVPSVQGVTSALHEY